LQDLKTDLRSSDGVSEFVQNSHAQRFGKGLVNTRLLPVAEDGYDPTWASGQGRNRNDGSKGVGTGRPRKEEHLPRAVRELKFGPGHPGRVRQCFLDFKNSVPFHNAERNQFTDQRAAVFPGCFYFQGKKGSYRAGEFETAQGLEGRGLGIGGFARGWVQAV
jgi:hypothetical protein